MKFEVGQRWIDNNGDWLEITSTREYTVILDRCYINSSTNRYGMEWTYKGLEENIAQYYSRLESKLERELRKIKADENE